MQTTNIEDKILKAIKNNENLPIISQILDDDKFTEVTFVYEATESLDNVLVVLPVGNKKLSKNLMTKIEDTTIWYKTCKIRNDVKFLYYFSLNDSLDVRKPRNLSENSFDKFNDKFILFNGESKLSYLTMPCCKENNLYNLPNSSKGSLTTETIYSNSLNKDINITTYLPFGFDTSNTYGLALFTDGDEHIELLSASTILDNLIDDEKIKPMIAVFIDSDMDRLSDLRCDKEFESFVINELLTSIKEKYNISEKTHDNLISGFSLGGLTAGYIGLRHSNIFGNILSQSGSFFFELPKIRKTILSCKKKPKVYLNAGVLENKAKVIDGNKTIYGILRKNNFNVHYEFFPSGHDYLSWGEYLDRGLKHLLSK